MGSNIKIKNYIRITHETDDINDFYLCDNPFSISIVYKNKQKNKGIEKSLDWGSVCPLDDGGWF